MISKKISHTSQTSAIHGKKNTPHLTNIRDLKLFSREKFSRKNVKKYVSHLSKGWSICQKGGPFVKRVVHLSKGWSICQKVRSICQKVRSICQRCPRTPIYLYYLSCFSIAKLCESLPSFGELVFVSLPNITIHQVALFKFSSSISLGCRPLHACRWQAELASVAFQIFLLQSWHCHMIARLAQSRWSDYVLVR